jgi:zinc protease
VRSPLTLPGRLGAGAVALGLGVLALAIGGMVGPSGCAHAPEGAGQAVPAGGQGAGGAPAVGRSANHAILAEARPDLSFWKGRTDLIKAPAPPVPAALPLPRVERWRLPNGLDVIAVPRQDLPIVSFTIAIKAGAYDEVKDRTQGVSDFTAAMLRHGAGRRTSEQIAEAIDAVGGALDASAGSESTSVSCSVLAEHVDTCLSLLGDLLLRPTFPGAEMGEIRDQLLAALGQRDDDPHLLAAEHFDNLLFGEGHPDGWVLMPEHVKHITREQLLAFWKAFYRPNNAMLAVAGAIDPAALKAQIARAFGRWQAAVVPARAAFAIPEVRGVRAVLVDKAELSQATLMFGHPGLRHADPDWYAATVVNYVLGGSDFSSRLMAEVRSKRGLTYGIGSSFGASLYPGAFRVSASTRNETAGDALAVAIAEIRKMKNAGPTAEELAKARGYFAGSTPFTLESPAEVARAIVGAELHGLGIDYVKGLALRMAGVDLATAAAAGHRWLDPDDLAIVIVGRAQVVAPQLRKAGIAFEQVDSHAPISAAARHAAHGAAP